MNFVIDFLRGRNRRVAKPKLAYGKARPALAADHFMELFEQVRIQDPHRLFEADKLEEANERLYWNLRAKFERNHGLVIPDDKLLIAHPDLYSGKYGYTVLHLQRLKNHENAMRESE